jgi:hypothetical protein
MVGYIRLRYDWLSHQHILTEEIIKRRVREPVSAGMRDALHSREGNKKKQSLRNFQRKRLGLVVLRVSDGVCDGIRPSVSRADQMAAPKMRSKPRFV